MNNEKRVGSPVVDLRQSLLCQADRQPPEDRLSKASADKLDKTGSKPPEKSMSKESRELESTVGRTHPREPRSDVDEGKQKSDQAAGSLIASRIERDKSQVGFTCGSVLVPYLMQYGTCLRHSCIPVGNFNTSTLEESQEYGMQLICENLPKKYLYLIFLN
jgi:hypothetical protein